MAEIKKAHNIILENRETLSVSGVIDVASFDDNSVVLFTDIGRLFIKGSQLNVNNLNVEIGELKITGTINSMTYSEQEKPSTNMLSRLFK